MCSKCHKELQSVGAQAASTAAAVARQQPAEVLPRPAEHPAPVAQPQPSTSAAAAAPRGDAPEGPKKTPTRCQHPDCKKKLGLTGFTCKCEMMFCPSHRLAESHHCSFDYKTTQRARLAENNPLIAASKIHKI
jgi:hypothetical protein